VKEEEQEFFISLFGGYILLILCVYAIRKKHLKPKRKNLFDLRFFYLSRGEEREDKKRRTKKEQHTHRLNSNLPGESIARERKSIVFCKQGKSPLFYKKQY